jgi:iron complex transport system substrate-binding protein
VSSRPIATAILFYRQRREPHLTTRKLEDSTTAPADIRGKTPQGPPARVVSLVPSITETLFDLGVGDVLVGITDFCIFPEELTLPRVGGTKNPDVDAIRALKPDLVHMNLEENLRRHGEAIEEFATLFVTEPKTVADVVSLIDTLGILHACESRAAELSRAIDDAVESLPKRAFTFACPIWKSPWMWCGGDTYVSNLVATVGGTNVLAERTRYPAIELEAVLALQPDVVFLPDEPYVFTPVDAAALRETGGANLRVIGPFPGHLFTWHGSRTLHGLQFLRETEL